MANHACMNLQIVEAQPLFCKERASRVQCPSSLLETAKPRHSRYSVKNVQAERHARQACLKRQSRGAAVVLQRTLLFLYSILLPPLPHAISTMPGMARFVRLYRLSLYKGWRGVLVVGLPVPAEIRTEFIIHKGGCIFPIP